MHKTFKINNIEYELIKKYSTKGPMISRVDGKNIENRFFICKLFLKNNGWTDEMFKGKNTNTLEREINKIINADKYNVILNNEVNINKNIPIPSSKEVDRYLNKWSKLNDYVDQEKALDKLFLNDYKYNNDLEEVLIKCSVLNDFYSTNIFKIYPVAKHILTLNIDNDLKNNNPEIVNKIASIKYNNKELNFYSFATKYCSHHKPLDYPIYDNYVKKVLIYFKKIDNFCSFNEKKLKDYKTFKTVLVKFKEFYKLNKYNLKELDRYLWQLGKEYFKK